MQQSPDLRIQLLGGFEVALGNERVASSAWRLSKARNIVKILALADQHRVHREQIIEYFWPYLEPDAGMNNLHRTVHAARRALASVDPGAATSRLVMDGEMLLLEHDGQIIVDINEFEAQARKALASERREDLEAALSLYAGALLPDDRYEDWTGDRHRVLESLYLDCLSKFATVCEEAGDYDAAQHYTNRILDLDPSLEDAHLRLMRIFALMNRRERAIRQYYKLQQVLERELGVEPSRETTDLFEMIQSGAFPAAERPARSSAKSSQLSEDVDDTDDRKRGDQAVPRGIPTNLPYVLTSFVGRDRELRDIEQAFSRARLVTLVGPAGAGKTRMAIRASSDLMPSYPDGVWFMDLSRVDDPAAAAVLVARTLGVSSEVAQDDLAAWIVDRLRASRTLIILDNCEHLIESAATLARSVIGECREVRVLATSREALRIAGELTLQFAPLPIPAEDRIEIGVDEALAYASIQLFRDRARLASPRFELNAENLQDVIEICRRLGGLPLALELAAARVRILSVDQVRSQLDSALQLLASGDRTAPARQQTMTAALDWSYGLLSEDERSLLRWMSVCAGGFTAEAATIHSAYLSGQGAGTLDLLLGLSEKSLLAVDDDGPLRFSMLEPVRQYALAKLDVYQETEAAMERLLTWYVEIAERADEAIQSSDQRDWLDFLDRELLNFTVSFSWAARQLRHVDLALAAAAKLWRWCQIRGHLRTGNHWLEGLLDSSAAVEPEIRADALEACGLLLGSLGQFERAVHKHGDVLAIRRKAGDGRGIARSLNALATMHRERGNLAEAANLLEESYEFFEVAGDLRGAATALANLGSTLRGLGDYDQARDRLQESLQRFQQLDFSWYAAGVLTELANVEIRSGNLATAERYLQESLAISYEIDDAWTIAEALLQRGRIARRSGDVLAASEYLGEALAIVIRLEIQPLGLDTIREFGLLAEQVAEFEKAARLLGATDQLREHHMITLDPEDEGIYESSIADLRAQLGDARFIAVFNEGRRLPVAEVMMDALRLALPSGV